MSIAYCTFFFGGGGGGGGVSSTVGEDEGACIVQPAAIQSYLNNIIKGTVAVAIEYFCLSVYACTTRACMWTPISTLSNTGPLQLLPVHQRCDFQ